MDFTGRLNSCHRASLVAFVGALVLLRWGHGNLHDFTEGALLRVAILSDCGYVLRNSNQCVLSLRQRGCTNAIATRFHFHRVVGGNTVDQAGHAL